MAGCGLRGPRCLGVVCVAVVCVGVAGCDPFQRITVRVLVSVVWVLRGEGLRLVVPRVD